MNSWPTGSNNNDGEPKFPFFNYRHVMQAMETQVYEDARDLVSMIGRVFSNAREPYQYRMAIAEAQRRAHFQERINRKDLHRLIELKGEKTLGKTAEIPSGFFSWVSGESYEKSMEAKENALKESVDLAKERYYLSFKLVEGFSEELRLRNHALSLAKEARDHAMQKRAMSWLRWRW